MFRLAPILLLAALALAGCPSESVIPSGENTRDYRISFEEASSTESCSQSIEDSANNFEPFSQIYRIWFPSGLDDPTFEIWWRLESEGDESLAFFSRGTMEGSLDQGFLDYAGGPFYEERGDGFVEFSVEGSNTARFGDELFGGSEEYIIGESDADSVPTGCVYTLGYTGRLLAEQGDVAE